MWILTFFYTFNKKHFSSSQAQLPDQNNDSVRLMLILGLSDIQILTKFLSGDYHEAVSKCYQLKM